MLKRLLSILLALALIVSLSVTVFAAGEQPSGSDYSYFNNSSVNYTSNYWTAVTKSLFNIGTNIYTLNHGSFNYVNTSGSSTSTSSGALDAITKSLTNIGYLIKNSSSNSVWSSTQASSLTSNSSTIASKSTSIESHTAVIDTNSTSIKTYTEDIYRNSNSLLSVLGSPDSGSTFWSNALAIKENSDSWILRSSDLNRRFKYFGSNGQITTIDAPWWSSIASSLINIGLSQERFKVENNSNLTHIDNDFHSLHNKIGNPIDEGSTFFSLITDLHTVFASPEDLEMHNNNSDNYAQVNDDFFTGQDSSSSIGTGTLSSLKGLADNVGSFFQVDSSIGPIAIFGLLDQGNDGWDGPWKWFSRTTLNDLDKVQSTRKSVPEGQEIVDFLTPHEEEFQDMLGADKR